MHNLARGKHKLSNSFRPPFSRRESRYTFWAGVFGFTCISPETGEILDEGLVCGKGFACPEGYECKHGPGFSLNYGVTGYYDIWHAMLQVSEISHSPKKEEKKRPPTFYICLVSRKELKKLLDFILRGLNMPIWLPADRKRTGSAFGIVQLRARATPSYFCKSYRTAIWTASRHSRVFGDFGEILGSRSVSLGHQQGFDILYGISHFLELSLSLPK